MSKQYRKLSPLGKWFIKFLIKPGDFDYALGDITEIYHDIAEKNGIFSAWLWFCLQVITSVPGFLKNKIYWGITMFKNYLKITFRNIIKHKGYSFINILGLAVGMTCVILIFLWVRDELKYDKFHENADELYISMIDQKYITNVIASVSTTPGALGPALKRDYPEIVNFARISGIGTVVLKYDNKIFSEKRLAMVDPSIFDMFTFPFVKGDPETALSTPHSIVITEEMAKKYFDDKEPLGKFIKLENRYNFMVKGILKNIPLNSSIRYDFFVPLVFLKELGREIEQWENDDYRTYILLKKNTPYETVNKKIAGCLQKEMETRAEVYIYPFNQYHLYHQNDGVASLFVKILSIVGLLCLIIACINFINLSTARSTNRAKEIGLRKVVGASRKQLKKQFLGESFVMTSIALTAALFLVSLILPLFNSLSKKQLALNFLDSSMIFGLIGIITFTGLLSGIYPAQFLSSLKPVSVFKGTLKTGSKNALSRKILVVIQFTVSIVLILTIISVYRQLDYIENRDLGFDKENVVYISMRGDFLHKYDGIKVKLLKNPNVLSVTRAAELPTWVNGESGGWDWQGKDTDEKIIISEAAVGFDYIETFNIKMSQGRSYSNKFPTDRAEAIIVNEEALKLIDKKSPLGKQLTLAGIDYTIIGVVKNYHYKPIYFKIKPLILRLKPGPKDYMFVRITPGNEKETIDYLGKIHKTFNPDYPFEYGYVDEENLLVRGLQPISQIIFYFTIIAIFVSCLGLLGLTSFTTEQKTREIGIRKVFGASVTNILYIISKEFSKCVLAAIFFAWAIAYFIMSLFLNMFAYRITIGIGAFILSGLLAFIIAILTVAFQSIKAATANPVDAIKYE